MLTDEQREAVTSREKTVIVTASAGAGKTSTMIERVIGLVAEDSVPLSSIIMLTFTKAATEEMKSRLGAALIAAVKEAKGEKRTALLRSLDELPLFSCATIDAFCQKVVTEHFEVLGLAPTYTLLDKEQMGLYRKKVIKKILNAFAERDEAGYYDFMSSFGKSDEKSIQETIGSAYEFVMTTEKGMSFAEEAEESLRLDIEDLRCVKEYVARVAASAKEAREAILQKQLRFPSQLTALHKKYEIICAALDSFSNSKTLCDLYLCAGEYTLQGNNGKESDPYWVQRYAEVKEIYDAFRKSVEHVKKNGYEDCLSKYRSLTAESEVFLRLLKEFDAEYRAEKEADRVMEFFDVEQAMLRLIREHDVAKDFGCRYLLVDECQDLNPLQDAIIRGIVGENDLFMVGDVKQSIFRFRLSDPELFLGRLLAAGKDPIGSKIIDFKENFRSSDAVVDFVNHVFSNIMHRDLGGVDYLPVTRGDRHAGSGGVRSFFYTPRKDEVVYDHVYSVREAAEEARASEDTCLEALWVRDRIREIIHTPFRDTKEDKEFLLSYKDIAIVSVVKMAPGNLQEKVVGCLREAGIPVNFGDFVREAEYPEIYALVDLLRLIESPHNDCALLSVMRSDLFGFSPQELAEISLLPGNSFAEKARCSAERGGKAAELYEYLDKMRFLSASLSLYELVSRIIEERFRTPVLNRPDGRKVFGELLGFAESLKKEKYASSISEYLNYFDTYFKMNSTAEVEERDAVRLMTVHKSKGLEFPVVFVIGLGANIVKQKYDKETVLTDKEYGIIKKPKDKHLIVDLFREKKEREVKEDTLRLMYVAFTRAKNALYLSGAREELPFGAEPKRISEWIAQGMAGKYEYETEYLPSPEPESKEKVRTEGRIEAEDLTALEKAFSYEYSHQKATSTGIKYTVTSINAMDEEGAYPATELFPQEKKAKGTAFHLVMQEIPFSIEEEVEVSAFLEKLCAEGRIAPEDLAFLSPGKVLGAVRRIRELVGDRTVMREKSFLLHVAAREVGVADIADRVEVQGKIDLLALGEGDAIIVDYKYSGSSASELKETYGRQLDLYALAVEKGFGVKAADRYIFVLGRNELIKL